MRVLLAVAALSLLAALATASKFVPAATDESIVTTSYGKVQGVVFPKARGFFAIPYAGPTSGANRWSQPVDPAPWGGVRNATRWGPACPQLCDLPPLTCPEADYSEDCLTGDIYTPRLSQIQAKGPFPVMIFFPGGNFKQGGSSTVLYNGNAPSNTTDVVIMVINYRLGALSFLINDQFKGNLAILDQTQAMKWAQENIAAFGGDPKQITIYGQSAGGTSTAAHLVSPQSTPFYNRVIMESNPIQLTLNSVSEMKTISQNFANLVNCSINDVSCLMALDVMTILNAQKDAISISIAHPLNAFMPWQPYVDGDLIPAQPMEAFRTGAYNHVPLQIGNVQDEGWLFIFVAFPKPMSKVDYELLLDIIFLGDAKKVKNMYPVPANETHDARPTLATLGTDYIWVCPTRNVTRYMAQNNPVYRYHFDHVLSFNPWGPNYTFCADKCCHGTELGFVFNSAPKGGFPWDPQEAVLAQFLDNTWGSFATSSNPNIPYPNNVQWTPFTTQSDADMHFMTPQSAMETGYRKTQCDMFDTIGYNHGVGPYLLRGLSF